MRILRLGADMADMNEADSTALVVARFRRRARNLRASAFAALGLVLVAIGGGMYLFVFAGEIASREANITLDRLSRNFETVATTMQDVQPRIEPLLDYMADMARVSAVAMDQLDDTLLSLDSFFTEKFQISVTGPLEEETEEELRTALVQAQTIMSEIASVVPPISSELQVLAADMRSTMANTKALSAESVELVKTLNEDMRAEISDTFGAVLENASNQSNEVQTTLLVSTLSTRVGAMLLIIFLVQILVNLYRYSMRLSSFYEARADAFEIAGSSGPTEIAELIRSLSPDNVDFGKSPVSPAEHAVVLAREVISRHGK